jgi:hypothetical protein
MSDSPDTGGFTPYDYRKDSFKTWVQKVDKELLMLHIDMQKLAALVNKKGVAGTGGNAVSSTSSAEASKGASESEVSEFGKGSDFSSVSDYIDDQQAGEEYDKLLSKIPDIESEEKQGMSTEDLVNATYAIHQAAHAMRGYLMLVDQLGLSKDQKKMVRDLEYIVMAVMKLATAISLVSKMVEGTLAPEAMPIFLVGGLMSASIGYGMKVSGSGV